MIQVREYATLTSDTSRSNSMDVGVVSPVTLDWLLELQQRWRNDTSLLTLHNRQSIKLGSYVGFLQSPTGEAIEILPKTQTTPATDQQLVDSRCLLREMLATALNLKPREADNAQLQRMDTPLHEWVIGEFLSQLSQLVRRGLRFDYRQVEEESRFIRGRINQTRQSRQTPDRATWFNIRHDIYSPDRVENRLLKTALDFSLKLTRDSDNWRLANELSHQLIELEPYRAPLRELDKWQRNKLMQPYEAIKPWCELILEKLNPNFQQGEHKGIALLFPMEYLFEKHVAYWLSSSLSQNATLKIQPSDKHLLMHQSATENKPQSWFQIKPDLMVKSRFGNSVLDTKWKLLDSDLSTSKHRYKISQVDLYQLYTYGQKYMHGSGNMMLIYPKHPSFTDALPVFSFDEQLHIWAVPFDLEAKSLVPGEWNDAFPSLQTQESNKGFGS